MHGKCRRVPRFRHRNSAAFVAGRVSSERPGQSGASITQSLRSAGGTTVRFETGLDEQSTSAFREANWCQLDQRDCLRHFSRRSDSGVFLLQLAGRDYGTGALLGFSELWNRHGISQAADAPVLQSAEGARVLPGGLRHAGAGGRADRVGGDASDSSSVFG